MGTNYYTNTKGCEHCGHIPQPIHLGKSSHGWTFSFQYNGGKYYKNVKEMKAWLANKTIEDEYGNMVSYMDFWKMIDDKQNEKMSHALYMQGHAEYNRSTDFVIDGYSFSDCEFC